MSEIQMVLLVLAGFFLLVQLVWAGVGIAALLGGRKHSISVGFGPGIVATILLIAVIIL